MKTRVETTTVPEMTYAVPYFGCEASGCTFETEDVEELKQHGFREHAVKKRMEQDGTSFYWFESEADARGWLEVEEHQAYERTYFESWNGPGWYGTQGSEQTGRCRCGGCTHYVCTLRPLEAFVTDWAGEISRLETRLGVLRTLVAGTSTL